MCTFCLKYILLRPSRFSLILIIDINECTRFGGTVCATNSECVNTEGSFRCQCKPGFNSLDGGKTCVGRVLKLLDFSQRMRL